MLVTALNTAATNICGLLSQTEVQMHMIFLPFLATNEHSECGKVYVPGATNLSIHCCYIISTDLDIVL